MNTATLPDLSRDVLTKALRAAVHPLRGAADDYDPLLELIGDARFVLIGEASHGTHEFYRERAQITKRLIREKGFNAVAVEADWPDAYRVNRYVRGRGDDAEAIDALAGFQAIPDLDVARSATRGPLPSESSDDQSPVNIGLRFSMNERIPSW